MWLRVVTVAVAAVGCATKELTYPWDDRPVVTSVPVDVLLKPATERSRIAADIALSLDEAEAEQTVAVFHAHVPGTTISRADIDDLLTEAELHDLAYVTFADLARHGQPRRAAIALAFDDNAIDQWFSLRDLFAAHGARVTFFVSRWNQMPDVAIDELRRLAADGHDLEPHSVNHLDAVDYVAAHGLDAYLSDEVLPSIQIMIDAGYQPTTFAYPFGAHDDAIDRAVLEHVTLVRTTL